MRFTNRSDAGKQLADKLIAYLDRPQCIILALPRGGVPVGFEIAQELHVPLNVILVRKLGVPGHEEVAFGAIANGNIRVLDKEIIQKLGILPATIEQVTTAERNELNYRKQLYLGNNPAPEVKDYTVILVDDGMATGATMHAAIEAVRKQQAARVVVAVPVAALSAYNAIGKLADEVVCLQIPEPFHGVGASYVDFTQIRHEEVQSLLRVMMSSAGSECII